MIKDKSKEIHCTQGWYNPKTATSKQIGKCGYKTSNKKLGELMKTFQNMNDRCTEEKIL